MPDTVPIAKLDPQQLLQWLSHIEDDLEFIDDNVEENPYESLEMCTKIRKNLNKVRGLITAALQH